MFPLALPSRHASDALRRARGRGETITPAREQTLTLESETAHVYDEDAFRHFLELERVRAARSNRPLLLLLVNLRRDADRDTVMPAPVARRLLSLLGETVREVDFVGWYRAGRVAGAVLAQGSPSADAETARRIAERVTDSLTRELPSHAAARLNVRVLHVGGRRRC